MTAAGLIEPNTMKWAAYITMLFAFLTGLYLVNVGGLIILAIGISSLVFGIMYTGGPFPLAIMVWGIFLCLCISESSQL